MGWGQGAFEISCTCVFYINVRVNSLFMRFCLLLILLGYSNQIYSQPNQFLVYEREIHKVQKVINSDSSYTIYHVPTSDTLAYKECLNCEMDTTYRYTAVLDMTKKRLFFSTYYQPRFIIPPKTKIRTVDNGYSIQYSKKREILAQVGNPLNFQPTTDPSYSWFLIPIKKSVSNHFDLLKNSFIRFVPNQRNELDTLTKYATPIVVESCPETVATIEYQDFIISRPILELDDDEFSKYHADFNLMSSEWGSIVTEAVDSNYNLHFLYLYRGRPTFQQYTLNYDQTRQVDMTLKKLVGTWVQDQITILPDSLFKDTNLTYSLSISENADCIYKKTVTSDSTSIQTLNGKISLSPSGERLVFHEEGESIGRYWNIVNLNSNSMKLIIDARSYKTFFPEYQTQVTMHKIKDSSRVGKGESHP